MLKEQHVNDSELVPSSLVHPGRVIASSHGPGTCKHPHSPVPAVWIGLNTLSPECQADLLQDTHPSIAARPTQGGQSVSGHLFL